MSFFLPYVSLLEFTILLTSKAFTLNSFLNKLCSFHSLLYWVEIKKVRKLIYNNLHIFLFKNCPKIVHLYLLISIYKKRCRKEILNISALVTLCFVNDYFSRQYFSYNVILEFLNDCNKAKMPYKSLFFVTILNI